jgi:hypothetical protein
MKYAQFTELCDREWLHGEMDFRDVVGITLSGPGLAELAGDILAEAPSPMALRVKEEDVETVRAGGAKINETVNPVTRSVVYLALAADGVPDSYTVNRGSFGRVTQLLPAA